MKKLKLMKKITPDSTIKFFVSVIGLFIIFFTLKELRHIFIPFVIAYLLFFVYEPMNNYLKLKKIPLSILIIMNLLITLGFFFGITQIVLNAFLQFGENISAYVDKLSHIIRTVSRSLGIRDPLLTNFTMSKFLRTLNYTDIASGILSSTIDIFTNLFLILFFFIFISSGHDKIVEAIRLRYVEKNVKTTIKKLKKELKQKQELLDNPDQSIDEQLATLTIQREMKLRKTFKDITEQIQKYILTKFFISILLGILVGTILWLFGVEFYIVWATLSVLLHFIPNIGSIIAVVLPSLMTLIQYESTGYSLLVAATIIIVHNIIGNIIEPQIFGSRLGLNPLVILLSLMLWGYLWGIVGMFLSVPITAVLKIIISNSNSKNMRFITNLMSN
ncbi:AI-2E family transporter [Rosettibacter firmus]|uniref:AI-2E family transporter n=1 Tax=Rosettibacter firmus TaxID=3111522 RepID=UPI00336BBBED